MNFLSELRRRNVVRVAVAYIITAWLLLQVADVFIDNIGAPDWLFLAILMVLALGFPLVLIFSWVFELTPEGLRRETEVDPSVSIATQTGRKLDRAIIVVLVLAVAYFVWESRYATRGTAPASTGTEASLEDPSQAVPPDASREPSIAVLPFVDLSPEGDQEYFSDGIAEELLNLLVGVNGLTVASRTSSFSYKNSVSNLSEIAEELSVDHILEGSVRKAGSRVRITAQLIDAGTDRHLWSDSFDRELEDIFTIQDEIANAIVNALRAELGMLEDAGEIRVTLDTENLDAYELYLKARSQFLARADLPVAVSLFEQAVSLDPRFGRAWAGLAATYSVMESWGYVDRAYSELAVDAAEEALEIDSTLSTPWAVLGAVARQSGDMISAARHLDKAIQLDPGNATHYLWRAILHTTLGFPEKARADQEKCLQLDPRYENCRRHLAGTHFILGNDDEGLRLYQEGAERGWDGLEYMMVQRMTTLGHRMVATRMVWNDHEIGSPLPGEEMLDAMEFPERDHSRGLEKMLAFLDQSEEYIAFRPFYLALFRAWHLVDLMASDKNQWVWLEENAGFRQSNQFKSWAREAGLVQYWHEQGFPHTCRPAGEADFECD